MIKKNYFNLYFMPLVSFYIRWKHQDALKETSQHEMVYGILRKLQILQFMKLLVIAGDSKQFQERVRSTFLEDINSKGKLGWRGNVFPFFIPHQFLTNIWRERFKAVITEKLRILFEFPKQERSFLETAITICC